MQKTNLAVALLFALRAYKPAVTLHDERQLLAEKFRAKRHKRTLVGRGYYADFLRNYFNDKRLTAMQAGKKVTV